VPIVVLVAVRARSLAAVAELRVEWVRKVVGYVGDAVRTRLRAGRSEVGADASRLSGGPRREFERAVRFRRDARANATPRERDGGFGRARTEEKPGSGLGGIPDATRVHAAAVVAVRSRAVRDARLTVAF
jgi:hypothetical protein